MVSDAKRDSPIFSPLQSAKIGTVPPGYSCTNPRSVSSTRRETATFRHLPIRLRRAGTCFPNHHTPLRQVTTGLPGASTTAKLLLDASRAPWYNAKHRGRCGAIGAHGVFVSPLCRYRPRPPTSCVGMHQDRETARMNRSRCTGCATEGCAVADCPSDAQTNDSLLVGWRLGVASMGVFLAPVVLAIVGAVCSGRSPDVQLPGTLAGLGLGLAGSMWIARTMRRVDDTRAQTPQ